MMFTTSMYATVHLVDICQRYTRTQTAARRVNHATLTIQTQNFSVEKGHGEAERPQPPVGRGAGNTSPYRQGRHCPRTHRRCHCLTGMRGRGRSAIRQQRTTGCCSRRRCLGRWACTNDAPEGRGRNKTVQEAVRALEARIGRIEQPMEQSGRIGVGRQRESHRLKQAFTETIQSLCGIKRTPLPGWAHITANVVPSVIAKTSFVLCVASSG
jgi:hypothetical protein